MRTLRTLYLIFYVKKNNFAFLILYFINNGELAIVVAATKVVSVMNEPALSAVITHFNETSIMVLRRLFHMFCLQILSKICLGLSVCALIRVISDD